MSDNLVQHRMVLFKISLQPSHPAPASELGEEWRERAVIKGMPDKIHTYISRASVGNSSSQGYLWFGYRVQPGRYPTGKPRSEVVEVRAAASGMLIWVITRDINNSNHTYSQELGQGLSWALFQSTWLAPSPRSGVIQLRL